MWQLCCWFSDSLSPTRILTSSFAGLLRVSSPTSNWLSCCVRACRRLSSHPLRSQATSLMWLCHPIWMSRRMHRARPSTRMCFRSSLTSRSVHWCRYAYVFVHITLTVVCLQYECTVLMHCTTALADSGDGRCGSEFVTGKGSREECRGQREQPVLPAQLLEPARLVAHVPAQPGARERTPPRGVRAQGVRGLLPRAQGRDRERLQSRARRHRARRRQRRRAHRLGPRRPARGPRLFVPADGFRMTSALIAITFTI